MHLQQRTLAKPVQCSGLGVHSGKQVRLTIKPAPLNHGIQFSRVDLQDRPTIPALFKNVVDTSLATVIGSEDGCIVSTIEHLLSALAGLSIDNAEIELDNYEMPIMDGSALPFTKLLLSAGIVGQNGPKCFFVVKKPIELKNGNKSVTIKPFGSSKITCTIDFPHPLIGRQTLSVDLTEKNYEKEISKARTFGFLHEVEYMKRFGLARGGSLDNAVVIGEDKVLNEGGLRFSDEFVRHKMLDCIGDFALLGMPVLGHIIIKRSGHAFHYEFLKEFFNQKACWETLTIHDISDLREIHPQSVAI